MEGIVLKAAWHWAVIAVCKQSGWGTRTHPIVCKPSVHVGLRGRWTNVLPVFRGGLLWWIWSNE